MAEKYQSVNGAWPDDLPSMTAAEAVAAGRRLYRFAFKRPFTGKIKLTSGRRYNTIRQRVMHVNPGGHHRNGWRDIVHDLSHYAHARLFPGHKPHGGEGTHAFMERSMIEHVVNSGWLDGKLKSKAKPKAVDIRAVRHERVKARLKRWEAKRKRAETAIRKLKRQKSYYAAQQISA
jgi:hypothetical protein